LNQEKTLENGTDTRDRILDAAERLFAEQGFAGTSLRQITSTADANVAAVNYHFGSKEALIGEVFARRFEPINVDRLAWLDRLESEGEPTVEQIVEAFLAPPLRVSQDPEHGEALLHVAQMIGHGMSRLDPSIRDLLVEQFHEIVERFTHALARAIPGIPRDVLMWRFVFMIGTMAHTMSMCPHLERLSHGVCDPSDTDAMIRSMVPFVAAGFRSAVPAREVQR
jgi:AcrR family transcriptional regulator